MIIKKTVEMLGAIVYRWLTWQAHIEKVTSTRKWGDKHAKVVVRYPIGYPIGSLETAN